MVRETNRKKSCMKYITTKDNAIIIFSEGITHREVAQGLGVEVRGAGFVNMSVRQCYGDSVSLNIPMHSKDTATLRYHSNSY